MKKITINLRTLLTVLSIMAILSFTVGGYLYYSSLSEFSKVRAYKESAEHLKDLGNNIDAFLNWSLLSVKSIAGLKEIKQSLLIIDEVTLADTNALLEQLRHDLNVSVCYLMDYSGNTIASSNHGEPNSFVGKNYGFRPYFKQAIQGKPFIYMALGITSMERGVYYSHPVFGKDEKKPLGVAVIKASIEIIERDFLKPSQGIVMLTDPHGLVFVSNRPDWLYQLLWQTSPEIVEEIEKQSQFGKGPWNWIGMKLINQDNAIDSQGNEYRVHRQGLANYPDWHLVYLHSHDEIMETVIGPLRKSVGVIVISLCIFFGFVVIFLFLKANTEIIQRKAVEIELRENEALLEDTGLMARVGGWQLDVETMAVTWTKETYRIHEVPLNYKPPLDKAIDFFHPDDREALSQAIQLALDRGEPYDMELQFITAKGNKLWTRTICRPEVVDGKTVKLRGTFQDITERKQAEAEREKLQAQLNQAQKMESVGRLAGGVAHDFNNMLGVILGHTELALLRTDDKHKLCSDLNEIQKAAKRSADITKQLLAFARKQTISPRRLDLNDTVESMLNMLRRLMGENIDLAWNPAPCLWSVKMDPSQIDQILANLCVNARDAIDGVGKLTIETGRKTFDEEYCKEHPGFIPGDFVLLAVSDNGCGMDKDTLNNLFEPFFTTKDVGKGTGLGLATIYGIVKQNNGFINVYSEPGQGSTFKIYLPRLVAEEDTDKTVPEKRAAAGGTETILLVEDEPMILDMASDKSHD